jgi:hypothetical protein
LNLVKEKREEKRRGEKRSRVSSKPRKTMI